MIITKTKIPHAIDELSVSILQPGYFPWLGFFEQLAKVDLFIYLDDVQYTKGDWRNRNRIRNQGKQGWTWLTVPVCHDFVECKIYDVKINYTQKWIERHINLVYQNYNKAPFFNRYFSAFKEVLTSRFDRLIDLDIASVKFMADTFGIKTSTVLSSDYRVSGSKTEKLINLCLAVGATKLYDGESAKRFLNEQNLSDAGIQVEYQHYCPRPYPQQIKPFIPYLSALDLLMNCGPQGLEAILLGGRSMSE